MAEGGGDVSAFTCPSCGKRQTAKLPIFCVKCGWPDRKPVAVEPKRGNKYHATVTVRHGITFRSKGEADRYDELRVRELAGEITDLEYEPESYPLVVNGVKITSYRTDFRYRENGVLVIEDFKSSATARARDWPIRKKLMKALYGIDVREWPPKKTRRRKSKCK
ncbi:MAG: DUF1064 domain-containing protein [Armatimonadota bacterium]